MATSAPVATARSAETTRSVIPSDYVSRRASRRLTEEDPEDSLDRTSWLPQPLLAAWLLTRGKKDRPDIDLLIRVSEWGSLRAYVDGQHAASLPEERSSIYGRLSSREEQRS
jgi:hypothetical protein